MKNCTTQWVVLAALLVLGSPLLAQNADVNAERVSMDMQMLNAISGKNSVGTMAVWPQSVNTITKQASDSSHAYGRYLNDYYGITVLDSDSTDGLLFAETDSRFRGLALNDGVVRLQGDINLMGRGGFYDNDTVADPYMLVRPGIRFMGSLDEHLGFFLDLSNGVRVAGDPRLTHALILHFRER